jgi:prepilin-type N-terminal cleavage/methylation domain-containing protein
MKQLACAKRQLAGFTLAELLVVVAIAGIVVAVFLPSLVNQIRLQNLKQAQQSIIQGIRQARALATGNSSAYATVTIQFFDSTDATLPNRYRICDTVPGTTSTCTGANWSPGTVTGGIARIAQEVAMPSGVNISKAYPVATPYFSFDFRGNVRSALGTVVVGVANLSAGSDPTIGPALTAGTTISTAVSGCPATGTLEDCIADPAIGANYKAVVLSTVLGKLRPIP